MGKIQDLIGQWAYEIEEIGANVQYYGQQLPINPEMHEAESIAKLLDMSTELRNVVIRMTNFGQ